MQIQNITVRNASQEDINKLRALAGEMKLVKDADYFEMQYERQCEDTRLVLIAQADGRDVAYCILNWQPKYSFFRKRGIPEIQDINVLQNLRRQGIAQHMIRYCEDLAREKGCEWMGIGFGLSAAYGPAQILYTKEGYVPDGNGVNYDRKAVAEGEFRPVDDNLCLMMVKNLKNPR
ncbi:MAG: GNAT family N-acetyltransferase [Alphaproteobacteria bacterium]